MFIAIYIATGVVVSLGFCRTVVLMGGENRG